MQRFEPGSSDLQARLLPLDQLGELKFFRVKSNVSFQLKKKKKKKFQP